ncbi:arginase family protein [Streptomyces janthinus]|uniref:Arginase family protein n=2 Tax=Streptomyces violaceus TaxID=1936 RepID=A0ABY9U3F7_STRVL|nr:arginase family protein [Streptomyces janthinus]WND16410.1 arginase family protein [Streptomyces janthinus]
MTDDGLAERDAVEAKSAVDGQLASALHVLRDHDPARITTLGGECAVSVAPFAGLARRYGDDLAVIWIDSHPDTGTPDSEYHGYHAMAVAALTGHGDPDVLKLLPATVSPDRVALVGRLPQRRLVGHPVVRPGRAARLHTALLDWLAATGCSRVAVHFDVDTVDSDEIATMRQMCVPGPASAA